MSVLHERAKIILVIEWVLCVLGTIGIIGLAIYLWTNFDFLVDQVMRISPTTTREHAASALKIYIISLGVIGLVSCLIQVALNFVLHKGVHQFSTNRDVFRRAWFCRSFDEQGFDEQRDTIERMFKHHEIRAQMSVGHLKFWYIVMSISLCVVSIGFVIGIANGTTTWLRFIGYLILFAYRGISIKIIKDFREEILNSGSTVYTTAAA